MNLTPVQMNTDEFYHVVRKRLYKSPPSESVVSAIAQAYAKAIHEAKQRDITAKSPKQFSQLVTTPVMLWSKVKKRAAMNPQRHRRDALDALKDDMVHKEIWREAFAGYVDRSPPPKTTTVQIQERSRDEDTGERHSTHERVIG